MAADLDERRQVGGLLPQQEVAVEDLDFGEGRLGRLERGEVLEVPLPVRVTDDRRHGIEDDHLLDDDAVVVGEELAIERDVDLGDLDDRRLPRRATSTSTSRIPPFAVEVDVPEGDVPLGGDLGKLGLDAAAEQQIAVPPDVVSPEAGDRHGRQQQNHEPLKRGACQHPCGSRRTVFVVRGVRMTPCLGEAVKTKFLWA